jgi:hypothetical protein
VGPKANDQILFQLTIEQSEMAPEEESERNRRFFEQNRTQERNCGQKADIKGRHNKYLNMKCRQCFMGIRHFVRE